MMIGSSDKSDDGSLYENCLELTWEMCLGSISDGYRIKTGQFLPFELANQKDVLRLTRLVCCQKKGTGETWQDEVRRALDLSII